MADDKLRSSWREGEDPEGAGFHARQQANRLFTDELAFEEKLEILRDIHGPLVDGPGRDPAYFVRITTALMLEWRAIEGGTETTVEERVLRRVELALFRARGLHCGGDSYHALREALAAHSQLEGYAGGRQELLQRLAGQEPDIAARALIAVLGIFAAALKRHIKDPQDPTRLYWIGEFRTLLDHYMPGLDPRRAIVYPHADALVQVLYLLAEQGDPADAARIQALKAFDDRVRPKDHRGSLTIPLRDAAIARFEGDLAGFASRSKEAISGLESNGLLRHLDIVVGEGYADPTADEPDEADDDVS